MQALNTALNLNGTSAIIYFNIGSIYEEQNDFIKAIQYYEKSIYYDNSHTDSYNKLGDCMRKLKRYEEAISIFHRAILISPSFYQLYFSLGNIYLDTV